MATPTTVLGALVNIWEGTPALTGLFPSQTVNGASLPALWVGQIPEAFAPPFACIIHNGEKPDWTFEQTYAETTDVSFVFFTEGLAALEAATLAVKAAFDWVQLSPPLVGVNTVRVERIRYQVSSDQRAADVNLVFRGQIDYQIEVMNALGANF